MIDLSILGLIQESWREGITTGGMTANLDVGTAGSMTGDMIAAENTAGDTTEDMAMIEAMDTDAVMVGVTADTYMVTVPDTGGAMGMAEEAMEEAMQEIIGDIMAGDTDTEEDPDGAGDIGVPITDDLDMTATVIGIEPD
jgi:hypothetical protein